MTTVSERLRVREDQVFLILTIVVGIVGGLSAVFFSLGIDWAARLFFGFSPSPLRLFLVPPLASVVTGIALAKIVPEVRGSGVPQTKAAYHLASGVIPWRTPIGKFITGVICIGSGHSMGREGPSVQIGAGLASGIGRWLGLSPSRVRDLVPVGAAGALAAAFNTPVAAVLFALEEIIGDMNASLIGSTVVASVASVIVERSILGNEPLFHVPVYHLEHPAELGAYALLGIVGGGVSVLFCKLLLGLRMLFRQLPDQTRIIQPAIGGLVIGGLLLLSPAVMGVGYEYVDQALNGGLVLKTLVFLSAMKLFATVVSYTSGNAGGIFAPSLYIGAMTGGAVGTLVHTHAPFPTAEPGAYALVGMGALFAGIVRAPMTSVFMIFEITQDYQILVPLMVANLLSYLISRRYQPLPVYEALLLQDNVHLPHRVLRHQTRTITARDVMNHDASVAEHPPRVHVHPDHTLDVVIDRLSQTEEALPVVSRADSRRIEGTITNEAIAAFLSRRSSPRSSPPSVEGAEPPAS
jgi:CIC family chloride channel protein